MNSDGPASRLKGLTNFLAVSDELFTSGQPTEDELVLCAQQGVQEIVNLALSTSDHALSDERQSVSGLKMNYVHLPIPFEAPTIDHFLAFESELASRRGRLVLVHCAFNWRGTSLVALYGERHLGWGSSEGDRFRKAFWEPNAVWERWAREVRALD